MNNLVEKEVFYAFEGLLDSQSEDFYSNNGCIFFFQQRFT